MAKSVIWKMLSWAVHQAFGAEKGRAIYAGLKSEPIVNYLVDKGNALLEETASGLAKKAGL